MYVVAHRRSNTWYLIGCDACPDTSTANQNSPVSFFLDDIFTHSSSYIGKVNWRKIVTSVICDLMPQSFNGLDHACLQWKSGMVSTHSNFHCYAILLYPK